MALNSDYKKEKEKALSGKITRELFPYLYEYYKEYAKPDRTKDYIDFANKFEVYLSTPVIGITGEIMYPADGLYRTLPKVFDFLDKKYEENEQ